MQRRWPARQPPFLSRDPARSTRPDSPDAQLLSSGPVLRRPVLTGEPWSPGGSSPIAPGKPNRPQHPAPADHPRCLCPLLSSLCLRSGSHLTWKGQTSASPLTVQGYEGTRGCVCLTCAHKYTVLFCFCICLCAQACSLFWAFFPSSLNRWGWAPSLFSSLPIQPHPLLGTCSSSVLDMVHLAGLAAAAAPQPPPLPTSGMALVPVRP